MLEKIIIFDKWNEDKKVIDTHKMTIFAKPRDICYIKLGINVGFEENGKENFLRPVIIISKIGSLYFVVPLTSKEKNNKYHYHIKSISFNNKKSFAILSQGRVIDGKRLIDKQGICNSTEFLYLKKILRTMYFPE